jgi:hypothetical protein
MVSPEPQCHMFIHSCNCCPRWQFRIAQDLHPAARRPLLFRRGFGVSGVALENILLTTISLQNAIAHLTSSLRATLSISLASSGPREILVASY